MLAKNEKRLLTIIVLGMMLFAVLFGLICRLYIIPSYAKEDDTTELTTYEYTSEQQEILDQVLNGEKPDINTPDDTDKLLDATGAWLRANGDITTEQSTETATETDADWDPEPYLSYGLDQRWIDDSDTVQKGMDDIYRILLSIRNLIIVLIGGLMLVWAHKMLKGIVYRLNGRGLR